MEANMMAQDISKEQYEFALAHIEELLPMVGDNTPANDRNAVELTMMSDVVIDYEKEHYSIGKTFRERNTIMNIQHHTAS